VAENVASESRLTSNEFQVNGVPLSYFSGVSDVQTAIDKGLKLFRSLDDNDDKIIGSSDALKLALYTFQIYYPDGISLNREEQATSTSDLVSIMQAHPTGMLSSDSYCRWVLSLCHDVRVSLSNVPDITFSQSYYHDASLSNRPSLSSSVRLWIFWFWWLWPTGNFAKL